MPALPLKIAAKLNMVDEVFYSRGETTPASNSRSFIALE
jgi:hypothetical protein